MELIEYLRFIFRYYRWLVVGIIIGLIIGGGFAVSRKDAYKASISLFVQRQPDASASSTQYYTYDGYYAQQTAVAYTDNAIKLLTNDEIVTRASKLAGFTSDKYSTATLKAAITAKKDAPQLIQLSVKLPNHDDAAAFSSDLAESLRLRTAEVNQEGDSHLAVDSVNLTPYVVLVRPILPLYGLIGAFFGFLLALVLAAVWQYLRHHRRR